MEQAAIEDRRRSTRMPASYDVFLYEGGNSYQCETRDISLHGVGLLAPDKFSKDTKMDLSIFIKQANMNFQAEGVVKHCTSFKTGSAEARKVVGVEFTAGHEKGLPFINSDDKHSSHSAKVSVNIDADARTCYQMICDVESFVEWDSGLEGAEVLERYPDDRAKVVRFQRSVVFRKFYHTDEFSYNDDEMRLSWHTKDGDDLMVSNTGSYTFKSIGKKRSIMTFQIDVTLSVIPSSRIINYLSSIFARKEMKNFKKYVEMRYQGQADT